MVTHSPVICTDLEAGITAIDTDYVRPLADASHLIVEGGRAAFVDTGTSHSVPRLLEALDRRGIDRDAVDYVLLTHVHLDHAGGAGRLMQALPRARLQVHPRGARHMADPTRLIDGTRAVYGAAMFAELYGEIPPVPAERIDIAEDGAVIELAGRPLQFLETPGHALHHHCIIDAASGGVFTGDAFGVSYRELDTVRGPFIFPTTTPVQFDPPAMHRSIDRILSQQPRWCYLTHYSRVGDLERLADDLHRAVDASVDVAQRYRDHPQRTATMQDALFGYLSERLDEHGFDVDIERRHAILDMDVALNVQGLEIWLERGRSR